MSLLAEGGKEIDHTIFVYRDPIKFLKFTLDYVFYKGKNIDVIGYLSLPDDSLVDQDIGNPNKSYPSDHYALAFTFGI